MSLEPTTQCYFLRRWITFTIEKKHCYALQNAFRMRTHTAYVLSINNVFIMLIGMILTLMTDQVLNETLTEEPDFNLRDGTALARRFFNRTTVIDGIPIYVDEVGERRVDMDIKQFNRASGEFEVINTKHVIKIDHNVMVAAQFVHRLTWNLFFIVHPMRHGAFLCCMVYIIFSQLIVTTKFEDYFEGLFLCS